MTVLPRLNQGLLSRPCVCIDKERDDGMPEPVAGVVGEVLKALDADRDDAAFRLHLARSPAACHVGGSVVRGSLFSTAERACGKAAWRFGLVFVPESAGPFSLAAPCG